MRQMKPNRKLQAAREARGLTQAMLAEELKVGLSTIKSWESGTRFPRVFHRPRLQEFFGMSLEELGFGTAQEEAPEIEQATEHLVATVAQNKSHQHDAKNRQRMIKRVSSRWINGVLDQVQPFIALNLHLMPERVSSPWLAKNQQIYLPTVQELTSTLIGQLYDEADGELLLLGEPGAGKTILLLQLARELLERAQKDATQPIPVIFHLSSWAASRTPLDEWLTEQVKLKYQVPERQAQEWISNDQLLPLLDGLDEVERSARAECINAINTYRQEHGFLPLVICCRTGDYDQLPERLMLGTAVEIQPLTRTQIDDYAARGGLVAMKTALEDPGLRDLVSTPLMLNILSMVSQEDLAALPASRDVVLKHYIERLLRKDIKQPYAPTQTRNWLGWLAWQMQQHNQSDFYLERIQPSWIENPQSRQRYRRAVIRLVIAIQCVVGGALSAWLKGGLRRGIVGSGNGILGLFGGGEGNTMLGWMSPGIGGGSQGGASLIVILALVIWLITVLVGSSTVPKLPPRAIWYGLLGGLRAGLVLGIIVCILVFPLFVWRGGIHYGLTYGLGIGFFLAIAVAPLRGFLLGLRYGQPAPPKTNWTTRLGDGAVWGASGAFGFVGVEEILRVNQQSTLIYGTVTFLFFFAAYGFWGGASLFSELAEERIQPVETVTWSWQRMFSNLGHTLRQSLIIALAVGISVSVVIATVASLFFRDPGYGIHYGVVFGTISGLIVAITGLLSTMLKSGWSGNLLPPEQHTRPNEGIIRSARNALLGACFFAPIGGIASSIACAVGFGLVGGLATWPVIAAAFATMLIIFIFLVLVTANGGIAIVSHYLLRWYLQREGSIPADYIRFLNGACEYALLRRVGGGYMFSHRLVLEHFARLYRHGQSMSAFEVALA